VLSFLFEFSSRFELSHLTNYKLGRIKNHSISITNFHLDTP